MVILASASPLASTEGAAEEDFEVTDDNDDADDKVDAKLSVDEDGLRGEDEAIDVLRVSLLMLADIGGDVLPGEMVVEEGTFSNCCTLSKTDPLVSNLTD